MTYQHLLLAVNIRREENIVDYVTKILFVDNKYPSIVGTPLET